VQSSKVPTDPFDGKPLQLETDQLSVPVGIGVDMLVRLGTLP
jgi:hypothetical protein